MAEEDRIDGHTRQDEPVAIRLPRRRADLPELEQPEIRQGMRPGQHFVRVMRPRERRFEREEEGTFRATERAIAPRTDAERLWRSVRRIAVGRTLSTEELDEQKLWELYLSCSPEKLNLSDRGYVSGLHPLELWLASYLQEHPNATWQQVQDASAEVRQEAYSWLLKGNLQGQDTRIRILLEQDAFARIYDKWRQVGYPLAVIAPCRWSHAIEPAPHLVGSRKSIVRIPGRPAIGESPQGPAANRRIESRTAPFPGWRPRGAPIRSLREPTGKPPGNT